MGIEPLRLAPPNVIDILDQTQLPHTEARRELCSVDEVCEAIRMLRVRGAPLLGLAGAAGLALAAFERGTGDEVLRRSADELIATRPTAVDLATLTHKALADALSQPPSERIGWLWSNAASLLQQRIEEDLALGRHGADLIAGYGSALTHCNAGALATGGIGTALGVIRSAHEAGTLLHCYATETRPLLQGARLTMWELARAGVPATLVPDTAGAALLASGRVGALITGADRIALNGDTANKIGTYQLALAAHAHGIPFYVAAPRSTFDPHCPDGESIPIEFRSEAEVGGFEGTRWSVTGAGAFNPAFDVTPAKLITAFVTESGVLRPPFPKTIRDYHASSRGHRSDDRVD